MGKFFKSKFHIMLIITSIGIIFQCTINISGDVFKEYQPSGTKGSPMVLVPAGKFIMGCNEKKDSDCEDNEKPGHEVFLDDFYIDKYEVSVMQYAECIAAGECETPKFPSILKLYCNTEYTDRDDHPINCVNWKQAKTYCEWVGKRLPTEAEWEKAAKGTDGRLYVWGDEEPSCRYANMRKKNEYGCGDVSTWPVNIKPRGTSAYGAINMAGNVGEWLSDWYGEDYYKTSPAKNPKGPESGFLRTVRGGTWFSEPPLLRASNRSMSRPWLNEAIFGIRCAK